MKIGITGCSKNLGKSLCNILSENHDVVKLSLKNYDKILEHLDTLDIFINNAYHETLQNKIFEEVLDKWRYQNKTIINILTSAIFYGGSFDDYRENKRIIQQNSIKLSSEDKRVRVTNIYPNTLEHNNRVFVNKLKHTEIADLIKYVINLPQDLELSHICISKTTLKKDKSML